MTNKQRTDLIEKHIREHKYADLRSLADRFGGSVSTVRRVLDVLESRGIVRRHHGGASLIEADALTQEHDFLSRIQRQADAKSLIASRVAEQIEPGSSVILDGGSSAYAVARLLAEKGVQVITNSLPIASFFGEIGGVEVIVTGGSILGRTGILVGPVCEQAFEEVHADVAVLGGTGVTEAGVWNHNPLVIAAQRKIIAAAERTIFALDNTKFGRKALSLTAPFDPRVTVVTDTSPVPEVRMAIGIAGAHLVMADRAAAGPRAEKAAPGGRASRGS